MEFAKQFGAANDIIGSAMQTFQALGKQNSPKNISLVRNKKVSEIVEKRG